MYVWQKIRGCMIQDVLRTIISINFQNPWKFWCWKWKSSRSTTRGRRYLCLKCLFQAFASFKSGVYMYTFYEVPRDTDSNNFNLILLYTNEGLWQNAGISVRGHICIMTGNPKKEKTHFFTVMVIIGACLVNNLGFLFCGPTFAKITLYGAIRSKMELL